MLLQDKGGLLRRGWPRYGKQRRNGQVAGWGYCREGGKGKGKAKRVASFENLDLRSSSLASRDLLGLRVDGLPVDLAAGRAQQVQVRSHDVRRGLQCLRVFAGIGIRPHHRSDTSGINHSYL